MKEELLTHYLLINEPIPDNDEFNRQINLPSGFWCIEPSARCIDPSLGAYVQIEEGTEETLRGLINIIAFCWEKGWLTRDTDHASLEYLSIDRETRIIEVWFGS